MSPERSDGVPFVGPLGEPVIVSASLADPTINLLVDAGDD